MYGVLFVCFIVLVFVVGCCVLSVVCSIVVGGVCLVAALSLFAASSLAMIRSICLDIMDLSLSLANSSVCCALPGVCPADSFPLLV